MPRVPAAFVERPRLSAKLEAGRRRALTLVSAGPGWGKTLVAAAWAGSQTTGNVAWVSLDERDNDPGRFWTYVVAALVRSGAIPDEVDLGGLRLGTGIDDALMLRIFHGLTQLPADVSIVLDDFHHVTDPDVLGAVERLLRFPRLSMNLVLLTRVDPLLPLHRLRLADELMEIRAADLAFVDDETARLLSRHGVTVDAGRLATLQSRTLGWAAGLRLAALSLQKDPSGAQLDGYHAEEKVVADYLVDEVLNAQPEQVQRFLLVTSVLERVTGELADTLTEERDGSATLERLEHDNAFVSALSGPGDWFRYHPMLRAMLIRELGRREPDLVPVLNTRASGWFAARELLPEAVAHAVQARNWALLARIIVDRATPRLLTVDRRDLGALLDRLPRFDDDVPAEVYICLVARCVAVSDFQAFEPLLTRAWESLPLLDPDTRTGARLLLHLCSGIQARLDGDPAGLVAHSREALVEAHAHQVEVPAAQEYAAIAQANLGMGLTWAGERTEAKAVLSTAVAATSARGVELTGILAAGHLAVSHALDGHLTTAKEVGDTAVRRAQARGWTTQIQISAAFLSLALVALDRDELNEAAHLVDVGLKAQPRPGDRLPYAGLLLTGAQVALMEGRAPQARAYRLAAHAELADLAEPNVLLGWYRILEAELDVAAGDVGAARARLTGCSSPSDRERTCLARVLISADEVDQASGLVDGIATRSDDLCAQVEAWLVRAVVEERRRHDHAATEALSQAIALAEPELIRRPFSLFPLGRVSRMLDGTREDGSLGTAFARSVLELWLPERRQGNPAEWEPLTDRERLVLAYLPTMLSNAEIADQMYISVNTVKAHLKSLYRKLGVANRREAVSRARAYGITPSGRGNEPEVSSAPHRLVAPPDR